MKRNTGKHLVRLAVLIALFPLVTTVANAVPLTHELRPTASVEIRGEVQLFRGLLTINLPANLRAPAPEKVSFRLELPGSPLLPSKLYFLKEEQVLLRWHEPVSARDPYPATGELAQLLREIPARILIPLFTGLGIEEHLTVNGSRREGGRTIFRGTLIGREVVLESVSGRARILKIIMQDGVLCLKWRFHSQARRIVLDVTLPGGEEFRLRMRAPRKREITEEEWVYLDQ